VISVSRITTIFLQSLVPYRQHLPTELDAVAAAADVAHCCSHLHNPPPSHIRQFVLAKLHLLLVTGAPVDVGWHQFHIVQKTHAVPWVAARSCARSCRTDDCEDNDSERQEYMDSERQEKIDFERQEYMDFE
jgi:hypothetical protein